MTIKILIAEDHTLLREGTRHFLEQQPDFEVVGEAENGKEALEKIDNLKPDVAVLDIRMPELNGIEVVRQMHDLSPMTKALMFTAYDDYDYIFALMEAGASGYLLKTAHGKELVDSIRSVYSGEPVLHPTIAVKIARLWAHRGVPDKQQKTHEMPSPRELEILELAAKGLRNRAIADELGISIRTVEGHLNSIFTKLGVSSRIEAILEAVSRHLVSVKEKSKE